MVCQAHKDNTTLQQWQMNGRSPVCQQMVGCLSVHLGAVGIVAPVLFLFSESCHCSLVAQWWWEYIMGVLILPHLQCACVLSSKEKRE